ncbi:hypothetical protein [Lyngbya sp. PCC 8106]|uniref:hypothetical protein n=1 Tax=Lyngbya sp. (strain PCC 8106) TaxID=313612 RepID=UPI0000EAC5A3|nr:hypothetical protein [Lyngbya sp. PCC 8106]EAW38512.1 hypothetical protein L8106_06914 [Lyngbya sp. PCC 8106]
MFVQYLRQFVTTPQQSLSHWRTLFWLFLSLTFSIIYSILVLQQAFDGEYVVQDDARKHIFWMRRFLDPELFPNDLIANFFASVEPFGLTTIYRFLINFNIDPMVINKCLPLVLGVIMTGYCFGICLQLFPIPMAAFIASLLFNQSIWMKDIFVEATASSFSYPLFFAFLYYFLKKSVIPCLIVLVLEGLFYPPTVLVSGGVLFINLFQINNKKIHFISDQKQLKFYVAGLIIASLMLVSYLISSSEYGPIINVAEAKTLPEFQENGRGKFFTNNGIEYWFLGIRSGMIPRGLFTPVTLCFGLFLPILAKFPRQFTLVKQIKNSAFFLQLLFVSLSLFFLAHLLLFYLFLPNRYTSHSFYLLIAVSTGITLTVIIDALLRWVEQLSISQPKNSKIFQKLLALGVTTIIAIAVIFYPSFLDKFTSPNYKEPREASLHDFLSQQPKDTLIASLSQEADNIPSFAQRSVLIAWEYSIPYQVGYHRQIRQRAMDLIEAQYSQDLQVLRNFIQTYNVDLILLDGNAFIPYYLTENNWFRQWKFKAEEIKPTLKPDTPPAVITMLVDLCAVYRTELFIVVDANCILELPETQ